MGLQGRILPPLSFLVLAAGLVALGAGSAEGTDGETDAPACLRTVRAQLSDLCGDESLRVRWSLGESLAARLSALPEARSELVSEGTCPDRVVAQVTSGSGASVQRFLVSGEVEVFGPVARARRTLRAGEIVAEEDVEAAEGWYPPSAMRAQAAEIAGLHVVRAVPAGRWIGEDDVGPPPLVRRGESIRIVYRTSGLELRALGTARDDGWIGDRLAVRVEGARHDCSGVVAGPGEVRVSREGSER